MKGILKSKKMLIAILAALGIILTTIGITVAWFSYAKNGVKEHKIKSDGITFHYQEESQGIVLTDAMPMTDAQGKSQSRYFDFRITANINNYVVIPYTITAKVDSNSTLPIDYVKVYLTDQDNNEIEPVSVLGELDQYSHSSISITGTEKILHEGRIIQAGEHNELYRLRMWVADNINMNADDSGTGTYNNATFKIKVNVYAEGKITDGTVPIQVHIGNSTYTINKRLGQQLGNIDATSLPEGIEIEGWYSDPTFTNAVTSSTIVSLSLTDLYAKYVNDYLRYSIRTDGGANTPTDITKYYSPYRYNNGEISTGRTMYNTITSTSVSSTSIGGCGVGVAMPMELEVGKSYIYTNSGTNFTETTDKSSSGIVSIDFVNSSNGLISYQKVVNNTMFTVPENTKYTIFVLVSNDLNCSDTNTATVYNPIIKLAEYRDVTLHLNGGTSDSNTFEVINGFAIGTLPSAYNDDYEFEGWYSDENFENQATKETIVTSSLTDLYAKWSNSRGYSSTGSGKTLTISQSGLYKLEVWGAQGGNASGYSGGYGAYSVGYKELNAGDKLQIYVGEQGKSNCVSSNCTGGYNGGGNSVRYVGDSANYTASGGGTTHIAMYNSSYNVLSSYNNAQTAENQVLIVAGGGGGAYYHTNGSAYSANGGSGGGATGGTDCNSNTTYTCAGGGSQISGGSAGTSGAAGTFGQGGSSTTYSSGGGGGWYGGGSGNHRGTAGGSGYIGGVSSNGTNLKHMYCYNCDESTNSETYTISHTQSNDVPLCHSDTPTVDCAKENNGYARITFVR